MIEIVPRRKHRTMTAGVFAFEDRKGLPFVLHMSSPDKFWLGLFDVVGKGQVRVEVNQDFPLRDAAQAHEALEARRTTGATVLVP